MRKSILLFAFLTVSFGTIFYSCKTNTDDLWYSINQLDGRVAALEDLCMRINSNINSLQKLVQALQDNNCITKVVPIEKEGKEAGYMIIFSKGNPITIYHGAKGDKGDKGDSGANGHDGFTPVIGVKIDLDNIYYWTLNGEWLIDEKGKKIKAIGTDGKDGIDGIPGQDGATPELKIENGRWLLSNDNGNTWSDIGQATGDAGKDGMNGMNGANGSDGKNGDTLFKEIDYNSDPNWVIFTLADNTILKLPTWYSLSKLQQLCEQLNANILSMQAIMDILQQKDAITNIVVLKENNKEVGYTFYFETHTPINIYHGHDGDDGTPGQDGVDGKDGAIPQIGVKLDTDNLYYWTLNGDWIKDDNNNKIRAQGVDGVDGSNGTDGTNGNDGITPLLKISEDGYWYVSYDNSKEWKKLGRATGADGSKGDSFFQNVENNENEVILTLMDGSIINLPKYVSFSISFPQLKDYKVAPGYKIEIDFLINGGDDNVKINIIGGNQHSIEYVTAKNGKIIGGKILLTASLDAKTEQIMVFAKSSNQSSWESFVVVTDYEYAEIGDLFYQSGMPIGFVCKTRMEGQSGMIISCIQSEVVFMWDQYDNPKKWLAACHELDSNWYIPSSDELLVCMQSVVDYGLERFNQIMHDYGYESLYTLLWSSTEIDANYAYAVGISGDVVDIRTCSRGGGFRARAIRKF